MKLIYTLGIRFYYLLILIASLFNKKAQLWLNGRKNQFKRLDQNFSKKEKTILFHCSSLGEFEQGRPVIEAYKKKYPEHQIVVTFFSPSGFEIRKNYDLADLVCYLPLDTKSNALKFIDIIQPDLVYFVKYEYWYYFLKEFNKRDIPVYLISAIFRENQAFFKWYGAWYRKILDLFKTIYVQNQHSLKLLKTINVKNAVLSGDTRFDRVADIATKPKKLPLVEQFAFNHLILICGSTWPKDEEYLFNYINSSDLKFKIIIAPHEVHDSHIKQITALCKKPFIKYSEANESNISGKQVLIIDSIGLLSSLYQFGDIAYIGGGFGVGIHNTLEAATFGMPVIFGPNYQKFMEAKELIKRGAAISYSEQEHLNSSLNELLKEEDTRNRKSIIAKSFVKENIGITNQILEAIK